MSRMLISLSGKKETGKDTVADILVANYNFKKLSFAKNLKKMCQWIFTLDKEETDTLKGKSKIFPFPIKFTEEHLNLILNWMNQTHSVKSATIKIEKLKKKYIQTTEFNTPREILQFVGTEICRAICNSYHIDIIEEKIVCNKDINYAVVDSRYPNERALLKKHGGILLLIKRDTKHKEDKHISENSLGKDTDYDYTIGNNNTISELTTHIRFLFKREFILNKEKK